MFIVNKEMTFNKHLNAQVLWTACHVWVAAGSRAAPPARCLVLSSTWLMSHMCLIFWGTSSSRWDFPEPSVLSVPP